MNFDVVQFLWAHVAGKRTLLLLYKIHAICNLMVNNLNDTRTREG